jgi:hypothetical protein
VLQVPNLDRGKHRHCGQKAYWGGGNNMKRCDYLFIFLTCKFRRAVYKTCGVWVSVAMDAFAAFVLCVFFVIVWMFIANCCGMTGRQSPYRLPQRKETDAYKKYIEEEYQYSLRR